MRRDDIRELRRANNAAHRTGSMAPVRVADSVGRGSAETYRLIRGLVKEPSGVTAGATFTIDNIEPLAGGLDPSGGTASFELEVDEAKQNYSDNAEVIAIYDPAAANSWVDITDVEGSGNELFDFLLEYGQTLTAGSWDDVTRVWTDGSGTVTLLTDNEDGTYDEAGSQAVKWRANVELTPPTGKAYRGHGVIVNGVYKVEAVYSCEGVTWTSGE